jgi:hypothetical protein
MLVAWIADGHVGEASQVSRVMMALLMLTYAILENSLTMHELD